MRARAIERSGLRVPALGFGTSGLGGMPATYGYDVSEERARETVRAVLARPDGFLDSWRIYGFGRSEARIDSVVRELGGWPEDLAAEQGIAVRNAAPYAGGALAKGTAFGRYVYQEATDAMLAPVRRVEAVCAAHDVPPGAVALQFSMRELRVASTICGVSRPERVGETLDWADWPVPQAVWDALGDLEVSLEDPEATRDYRPG